MSSAKPITCRAAVMYDYNAPLVVEQVQIAPPTGSQVRVKLVSSGLCLTDVTVYRGHARAEELGHKLPLVLGHEGAGIVESVGPEVKDLKVGDHVLTSFLPRCNDCPLCLSPRVNLCAKENFFTLASTESKVAESAKKEGIQDFIGLGTLSEYLLLKRCQVEKIDSSLPNLENLSIVCCAIASGYFAVTSQAEVAPDSTVAIWGLSGFGINAAYAAKNSGAKNIIVVESTENPDWPELAKEFGVTELVNPKKLDKPVEQYLQEKYGGVDYVFECSGTPEAQLQGLASLNLGGVFTFTAMTHTGAKLDMPLSQLFTGKAISMSIVGRTPMDEVYRQVLNMYRIGRYPIEKLVTHKYPLAQVNEAMKTFIENKALRVVIKF